MRLGRWCISFDGAPHTGLPEAIPHRKRAHTGLEEESHGRPRRRGARPGAALAACWPTAGAAAGAVAGLAADADRIERAGMPALAGRVRRVTAADDAREALAADAGGCRLPHGAAAAALAGPPPANWQPLVKRFAGRRPVSLLPLAPARVDGGRCGSAVYRGSALTDLTLIDRPDRARATVQAGIAAGAAHPLDNPGSPCTCGAAALAGAPPTGRRRRDRSLRVGGPQRAGERSAGAERGPDTDEATAEKEGGTAAVGGAGPLQIQEVVACRADEYD
ncbi:MAG: hypothetical protein U0531_10480 [Dehalococcoidia bacterium]